MGLQSSQMNWQSPEPPQPPIYGQTPYIQQSTTQQHYQQQYQQHYQQQQQQTQQHYAQPQQFSQPSQSVTGSFPAQSQDGMQQAITNVYQAMPAQNFSQPLPQQVVIPNTVSYDDLARLEAYRLSQISGTRMDWAPTPTANPNANTVPLPPTGGAPTFAQINGGADGEVSPALISEMESLNAGLIRERMFLVMHCAVFLVFNLVGFWLAMSCYYGIHGDEVTKLVMAFTPLTFINFVALSCLAPIKGTRREISRLLEKKQYVQFQMEYSNIMR
jgi:hypothetical protein